jgi:hypothetical protein
MHDFIDITNIDKAFVVIQKGDEQENDFQDIKIAPVIVLLNSENETPQLDIDKMVDGTIYEKYDDITYKIGKAVRISELINDELQRCIQSYDNKIGISNLINRSAKGRELGKYDFSKLLTFMQLKQTLSCIVKTEEKIWQLEDLNTSEKRNHLTKTLTNFIFNRDFLVHGTLHFLYPEFKPILKISDHNKNHKYFIFKDELIKKTIIDYNYLKKNIGNITFLLQQNVS